MHRSEDLPQGELPSDEVSKIAEIVTRILSGETEIQAAFLFGSVACGQLHAESDIDIAVRMSRSIPSEDKIRLIEKISANCLRPVDLLDLRQIGPVLLKEILRHGKPIIEPAAEVLEELYQQVVRNEADYLPLRRRARSERVEGFARQNLSL